MHAAGAGGLLGPSDRIVVAVVDDHVGPQVVTGGQLVLRGGGDHPSADRFGDLDGGGAHARGAGVDERPATGGEPALDNQGVEGGEKGLGNRRRVG